MEAAEFPLSLAFDGCASAPPLRVLPAADDSARLSHRERECLDLAANGMTSADIGVKLGIAERTVNFHFGNVFTKLGVLNRAEAIAQALAQKFIPLSRPATPAPVRHLFAVRR
jgi:DNA-binding CsgD family transcriptional regulator